MRFRAFAVAATGLALLSSSASAYADNVVVGNPQPSTSKFSTGCQGLYEEMCTFVWLELPKFIGFAQSPVDGAIVRWGVRGASHVSGYAIRALESKSGLKFTGDGTSERVDPAGPGVETFTADLPIRKDEFVGLDVPPGGGLALNKVPETAHGFFGDLTDGSTMETGSFEGELGYFAEIQPAPAITQVTPITGPTTGGTAVNVAGSDFRSVTNVEFGTVPAISFAVESDNSLVAIAPPVASPQFVDISVATIAGRSKPTFHDFFEYVPAPTASSPACVVPKLLGAKLRVARKRAKRAECAIGHVRRPKGSKSRTGRVIEQRPKPGAKQPAGRKIVVTLG